MPVIRAGNLKPKQGRITDTHAKLPEIKKIFDDSGARASLFWQKISGPNIGDISFVYVAQEDGLANLGSLIGTIMSNEDYRALNADPDLPMDFNNGYIIQDVYTAGQMDLSVQLRTTVMMSPNRGRNADSVRRLSRIADELVAGGAQSASVRTPLFGNQKSLVGLFAFYSDWDALETSRQSLQESNVWSAISQSQDETGELLGNQIDVRVL